MNRKSYIHFKLRSIFEEGVYQIAKMYKEKHLILGLSKAFYQLWGSWKYILVTWYRHCIL